MVSFFLFKNSIAILNIGVPLSWFGNVGNFQRMWLNFQAGLLQLLGNHRALWDTLLHRLHPGLFNLWLLAFLSLRHRWSWKTFCLTKSCLQPCSSWSMAGHRLAPDGKMKCVPRSKVRLCHLAGSSVFGFTHGFGQLQNQTVVELWWFLQYYSCCFSVSHLKQKNVISFSCQWGKGRC